MNKKRFALALCIVLILTIACSSVFAFAGGPTDEIQLYTITADVNEDATVHLRYHIEWKVLESDGIGPLEWVTVGVPNSHVDNIEASSSTINSIRYTSEGGESYVRIDFDKKYYKGETVSFDFELDADYIYSMNALKDGETVYYLIPGWFDDINVVHFELRWNADKALSWSEYSRTDNGYLVWTENNIEGYMNGYQVTYENDAFAFDDSKYAESGDGAYWDGGDYYDPAEPFYLLIGALLPIGFIAFFIGIFANAAKKYNEDANFATKTKITRTKIEYYPNCPSCGAQRGEGQTTCEYCGRSYIKSEEIIKEDTVADKDALKYKEKGEYHYGSSPNTFVRVNVVHVPVSRPSSSGSHRGGGHSSGCAHSSCACACVSCACACACACAGGGRAGCSAKDFYNTGLKLKSLELRADFKKDE